MLEYKNELLDLLLFTEEEKNKPCKYDKIRQVYINPKSYMKRVKLVAESDLPNSYFVQLLYNDNCTYQDMEYLYGFAEVLCYRCKHYGFSAIEDVAKEILIWWDYYDKDGFSSVRNMVKENKSCFIPVIKDLINDIYHLKGFALTFSFCADKNESTLRNMYSLWLVMLVWELLRIDDTSEERFKKLKEL